MVEATLPAPVALPSLPAAFSRRAALFGAVSATGFLGAAAARDATAAAPPEAEPIVALHRRFLELQAAADALFALSDEESEAAWDRTQEGAHELFESSLDHLPSTLPGAVAALAWARWEFGRHYVETATDPDQMDRWTLAMLDGALGVLRRLVEGGVA